MEQKFFGRSIWSVFGALAVIFTISAGWGQFISSYAKADHVEINSRNLGELLAFQKIQIVENRREYWRGRLRELDSRIFDLEERYLERSMSKFAKNYYERLRQEKLFAEGKIK